MEREIYLHAKLFANTPTSVRRDAAVRAALAAAPLRRRSALRQAAHMLGGILLELGARLRAYGVPRSDNPIHTDWRYS